MPRNRLVLPTYPPPESRDGYPAVRGWLHWTELPDKAVVWEHDTRFRVDRSTVRLRVGRAAPCRYSRACAGGCVMTDVASDHHIVTFTGHAIEAPHRSMAIFLRRRGDKWTFQTRADLAWMMPVADLAADIVRRPLRQPGDRTSV